MKKIFAALMALLLFAPPTVAEEKIQEEKVLNVFNWFEYIPQIVLDQFTKETGIKVVYTTFESNEAMYAKLKLLGGKGYDLVVPSAYFVELLKQDNLLAPLDKSKLGDLSHIDPTVMGLPFDPDNQWAIPYMWGVTGLLFNKKAIDPALVTSWNDLNRPEFKGRVLLSNDPRDAFGVALKALGFSGNSTDETQVKAAYAWLKALKPAVRVFDVTVAKQTFISEEVLAGVVWNGDAFIAMQENPNLEFVFPKEGAPLWLDSLAIPVGAEHKGNAHAFIRFILRPDIAKLCVEEFNYTTPNLAARPLLEPELRNSKVILPDATSLKNSEFQMGVGQARELYDRYWEQLKAL